MKLQPNFSWQKYEGTDENQKQQFQYQLMQQHVLVANSVNGTVNDISFWGRERRTGYTWVIDKPVWTLTLPTTAWTSTGTINTIPLGIVTLPAPAAGGFVVIDIVCDISNGTLATSTTLPLPYLDPATGTNSIGIKRVGQSIVITSGGFNYSAYSGYVTVYYYKT
jgi:hypothetical protein